MNVGSLFSGVGGFDLGLEAAGMSVAWQAQWDPELTTQWPSTERGVLRARRKSAVAAGLRLRRCGMNRILWNRRPVDEFDSGDIDEVVIRGCTVHIEQMGDRSYWVGIYLPNGSSFDGNFFIERPRRRPRLRFGMQESNVTWDRDESHEEVG